MFHSFYATTKDRKGNEHNYRLPAGTGVPSGHEITSLTVGSRFKLSDIVDADTYELLVAMSSKGKASRAAQK
jgi:hypothetical protein